MLRLHVAQTVTAELSNSKGSLRRDVVDKDRFDTKLHPEIEWNAEVRLSGGQEGYESLPHAERAFLRRRRRRMLPAFAKYISVPESELDERDLPIVGIAASGGCATFPHHSHDASC